MDIDGVPLEVVAAGWWDFQRRSTATRAERKNLEMGAPASAVRAWETVNHAVQETGGTQAVELILALIRSAPSLDDLVHVGAGPLEDLLSLHGDDVIDRIEALARAGGPMRRTLRSVDMEDGYESRLRPWSE